MTTLSWALLLMARHPEVQQRVRDEIRAHLGDSQRPTLATDREAMRFTEAVVCEVHRYASVVPVSMWHRAVRETRVRQFAVPADALVVSNLYAVHRQPDLWPDPEHFNPEANFLAAATADGSLRLKNVEFLVPFGVGRRQCIGEAQAKQELWTLFVGLLQRFRVETAPGEPLPTDAAASGGTIRAPPHYRLLFVRE